jgi:hypothetical protein
MSRPLTRISNNHMSLAASARGMVVAPLSVSFVRTASFVERAPPTAQSPMR